MLKSVVYSSLIIVTSFLGACSDDPENGNPKYSGIWYNSDNDTYLEISEGGAANEYSCTLNDGYAITSENPGSVEGDSLTLEISEDEPVTLSLARSGDTLQLTLDSYSIEYQAENGIPDQCFGDAIEITYASPLEAEEGIETQFLVNFDYRLTAINANVELGFTSADSGVYTISEEDSFSIDDSGTGSGSLVVNEVPVRFENSEPYYLYVNMSPKDNDDTYSPYASDRVLITVNPSDQ